MYLKINFGVDYTWDDGSGAGGTGGAGGASGGIGTSGAGGLAVAV